jgi:hypothetical protein
MEITPQGESSLLRTKLYSFCIHMNHFSVFIYIGVFYPWIRDPGWKKSGSGINIADHFFKSLVITFGLKILKFVVDPDPGSVAFFNRDPRRKNSDPGSGINIPDPQHWDENYPSCYSVRLRQSCNSPGSKHPPTQLNLRGGR